MKVEVRDKKKVFNGCVFFNAAMFAFKTVEWGYTTFHSKEKDFAINLYFDLNQFTGSTFSYDECKELAEVIRKELEF